jgi:hypothetical protein
MKTQKTWLTVLFKEGEASIELTLHYVTKNYTMTHSNNDNNITFNGNAEKDTKLHIDRVKCVAAALKFIEQELN